MRKLLTMVITLFVISASSSVMRADDFQSGTEVHKQEGFDAVLHQWELLPDHGDPDRLSLSRSMNCESLRITQNYTETLTSTKEAAEQGVAVAQYSLGLFYLGGHGVLQDYVTAHVWLNVAAANGYKDAAKHRDILAYKKMTTFGIEEAQKRAKVCMETNYQNCD